MKNRQKGTNEDQIYHFNNKNGVKTVLGIGTSCAPNWYVGGNGAKYTITFFIVVFITPLLVKIYLFGMTFSFIKVRLWRQLWFILFFASLLGPERVLAEYGARLGAVADGVGDGGGLARRLDALHLLHTVDHDQQNCRRREHLFVQIRFRRLSICHLAHFGFVQPHHRTAHGLVFNHNPRPFRRLKNP